MSNKAFKVKHGLELPSGTAIEEFSIDGTLAGNSDNAVPTEKAVKTYIDSKKHVPTGGTSGYVLSTDGSNNYSWIANPDTTYTAGTGITLTGTSFSASAIALTSVQTSTGQAAHLALTAEEGDIVVRTDENKTYCHNGGTAGTMADYTLLATPTDAVTSVDGNTGAVTLNHDSLTGFVSNEHIDWTTDQGATNLHTGNYTDTTYTDSDFSHDSLSGVTANEHIDWTTDQGVTNLHTGNYTDTTYTASGLVSIDASNVITTTANNYTHPASHAISDVTNLQTELDATLGNAVAMAIALG